MSYSSELKEELAQVTGSARHCRIAQLAAFICLSAVFTKEGLEILSESPVVTRCCVRLFKIIFGYEPPVKQRPYKRRKTVYTVWIPFSEETEMIFSALKMSLPDKENPPGALPDILKLTVKKCCRASFIRGAFIAAGSISNPDRFYHFEIPCRDALTAAAVKDMLCGLSFDARLVKRQKYHVVYIKESEQISALLGIMGARKGLLEFENTRILREVRGNINRRVNCETANINKTAKASAKSIDDINYIKEHMGLQALPIGLDEMAYVRLQYPEATLGELGLKLEPPVGKSGVNHRLRKLSRIAEALREQEDK